MKRKNKLFYQTKIMHFKGNIIFIWSSFRLIFLVITDIIYFHRYRHVISRSIDIFCTCHRLFFNCYNFIPRDSGEGYSNECRTFRPRTFQPWTFRLRFFAKVDVLPKQYLVVIYMFGLFFIGSCSLIANILYIVVGFLFYLGVEWGGKRGSMRATFVLFVSRFILNKSKKITNKRYFYLTYFIIKHRIFHKITVFVTEDTFIYSSTIDKVST